MPRPYTKRNEHYWNNLKGNQSPAPIVVNTAPTQPQVVPTPFPDIFYGSASVASAGAQEAHAAAAGLDTLYRPSQANNGTADPYAFQNIRALPSTLIGYSGSRDYIGLQEPIFLCMKAWSGVSVVRNAIEVSVEFSSQPLWFKSDNKTVQTFFEEWWKAVRGSRLVEQAMREYYRSGNVFFMSYMGRFGPDYYKHYQQSFGAKENKIPIRYEVLNPSNVFVPNGITYPYTYVRMLSTYEIERLKNPITEQDRQVFNDLPENIKKQMKSGSSFNLGIWVPLIPDRLRFFFYKKQDYEPLAVPMVWPVLPDIELKLALKKMDMELARKIEHAILIVTTGEKPDQWNGGRGINQNNIARLQALFSNQAIHRVLVADYTTKAEWAIPDVKEILGSEKYKVVDQDIREGLQSILTGEDKFANAQIKAKIFIQRLEEGQNRFLEDFLMPEIVQICDRMGFRNIPQVGFQKINLSDETVMARVITQLGQIGILTAEQVVKAIDTGILPNSTEMKRGQEQYKKDREDGLYEPLIGGQKEDAQTAGRPSGSGTPQSTKKVTPIGTKASTDAFSIKLYANYLRASQDLVNEISKTLCRKHKLKELSESQKTIVVMFAKSIMANYPSEKWESVIPSVIKNPPKVSEAVAAEIDDIRIKYEVDEWDACILRMCKTTAPGESFELPKKAVAAEEKSKEGANKLVIELNQSESKPKTLNVKKTAQGFQIETKKD